MTLLAGDIGGTKTLLALYDESAGGWTETARQRYDSGDYTDFSDLLDEFLTAHPATIEAAAIGIAGPVIDQRCEATNLPWIVRADALRHRLGGSAVFLLNDLQATAYGMLHLDAADFVTLNDGEPGSGNAAVIAAGTGLGEAILCRDSDGRWHPLATEGGHCDFAPRTPAQDALLRWLRQRHPDHVSLERIVSGPGLEALYRFLADYRGVSSPPIRRAHEITRAALDDGDALCHDTLALFAEIYGAEAGNLALKCLARGGVYVGGGIAPKILPVLQAGHFMRGFTAKGRFAALLASMPVKVALNESTALLGAAHYAANHR